MSRASVILRRELIGLEAKVVKATNPSYVGISGRVIDETKETVTILSRGEEKTIIKRIAVFHFTLPDGTVLEVDGKVIVGRPEDRIKGLLRRGW